MTRGFVWCQGEMKHGKAKVKWDDVCLPKTEGGLGIRRLKLWNLALLSSQFWRLLSHKQSLWVKWVHTYRLANPNFWDVVMPNDASWSWRKMLNIRDIIHIHVVHKIGNGTTTNAWFDRWHPHGTIVEIVSRRNIVREGYNLNEKVCDVMHGSDLTWPSTWYTEFNAIQDVAPPILTDQSDIVQWRDCSGNWIDFSVNVVWDTIRPYAPTIPWCSVIWYSQCIP
ncbi:uncharacterized mitochondrial protein AtMg00310-like [Rutidosis leptorrhynchoides]|uniref:uncharacterized mitochondrial protein AtMg00310-like n=1 Tax=Rutidosis leptorrhynchoides TaxID=125765 RepID=UPI003A9A261E